LAIVAAFRMSSKAALKAVRTALDSKDFELAAKKASELVQQEPQNYHAYVRVDILLAHIY
jgi:superkiller protein 3